MTLDILFRDLDDEDTKHFSGIFRVLFLSLKFIVNLTAYVLLFIGNVILSGNSRKNRKRHGYVTPYGIYGQSL